MAVRELERDHGSAAEAGMCTQADFGEAGTTIVFATEPELVENSHQAR
jgi:hypothetical protein